MAGIYGITANDVRRVSGLNLDDIVDTDVEAFIPQAEVVVERFANCVFLPKTTFQRFQGDGSQIARLDKTPVTRIVAIEVDGTTVTPAYTRLQSGSGILKLLSSAEVTVWDRNQDEKNVIKYQHAKMQESSTETTTTANETAGTGVTVNVSSTTGIAADDYVKIEGMDGNIEITKVITVPNGTSFTADLSYDHESGSRVVLMRIPLEVKRAIMMVAGIMTAMYKIGGTNDFQTGYQLGDFQVQKGEPYPPFDRLLTDLEKESMKLINGFKQMSVR